jgi:hypothetical protein
MIKELFEKAGDSESVLHDEKEKDKLGVLRAGTTGHLNSDGLVEGKCHRKALIRFLGLQPAGSRSLWFDMGAANEMLWLNKLTKSWPNKIRAEEEYPIQWELDGTPITGRPDMVLFDEHDKPFVGVELKSIGSMSSAVDVAFGDKPKKEHLLQAAHYSGKLGIPWYLVYTFLAKGTTPYWAQKKYKEKEISPFVKEFKVWIDAGVIWYQTETGTPVKTRFDMQGITDYYRLIVDMQKSKNLYQRYTETDLSGELVPYNVCNNCTYKDTCDNYEGDYDRWVHEVETIYNISHSERARKERNRGNH